MKKLARKFISFSQKNLYLLAILFGFHLLSTSQFSIADNKETNTASKQKISLITVDGIINPGSADYIRDAIRKAENNQSHALIFQLNTPGGLLSSTRDIIQMFSTSRVPVILYVTPGGASATSAGAIISFAAHVSAMTPGTNIGAAHPVSNEGKDVPGDMGKKVTNDTAALVRSQAKLYGRNSALAEKMVTESLSFSADEALKKNITDIVAKDLDDLLKQLDGRKIKLQNQEMELVTHNISTNDLEFIPMTSGQQLLHLLANPNISTLLMTLGGIAIYSEISSGFSLIFPGVFGVLCFILAFISLQTLPINIGSILLLLVGIILLIGEAFVTSFGILTVCGLISITIGALFLTDPAAGNISVSLSLLIPILSAIGFVAVSIAYMFSKEKRMKKSFDPFAGQLAEVLEIDNSNHSGKVRISGEIWNFTSLIDLKIGDKVHVSKKDDLTLEVTQIKKLPIKKEN